MAQRARGARRRYVGRHFSAANSLPSALWEIDGAYVLVLLFLKYVSDKYAGQPVAPTTIPPGASFADMVALKSKPEIGDQINKKIIAPLANATHQTEGNHEATKHTKVPTERVRRRPCASRRRHTGQLN